LWNQVDGKPVINHWTNVSQIPAKTPISERLAKEFKAQGFKFIGPTVAYAFMQAIGMVNDHETGCDRHKDLAGSTQR
jgi:DNA-3-methyladenine glycosylase I